MGGKSKSSQATTNHQTTQNIVNDGEFAGVEGNISIDESSQSLSYRNEVDNSSEYSSEIDNSIEYEDSRNIDNSVQNDIDNSVQNDIDNSIENDGDYAGNYGNITLSDSGAITAASSIANAALSGNEKTLKEAFSFGGDALDEVQTLVINAFKNSKEQSENFSDNVESMLTNSQASNATVLSNALTANTDDKALIADLAKSTSLAGQDLVAKSSERMTLYMSLALGIGFVAIIFFGARNNA